jgi:hypothetical protein
MSVSVVASPRIEVARQHSKSSWTAKNGDIWWTRDAAKVVQRRHHDRATNAHLLSDKSRGATGKSLIVLDPSLSLNQRVPGSSPGAPTTPSPGAQAPFALIAPEWRHSQALAALPAAESGLNRPRLEE